jgi:preprotein translocase subunit SecG
VTRNPSLARRNGGSCSSSVQKVRRNTMKRANRMIKVLSAFFFAVVLVLVLIYNANASAKFTKETGKKCADCHSKIPKKGEAELYLTELGKKFKENGNKMPEGKK